MSRRPINEVIVKEQPAEVNGSVISPGTDTMTDPSNADTKANNTHKVEVKEPPVNCRVDKKNIDKNSGERKSPLDDTIPAKKNSDERGSPPPDLTITANTKSSPSTKSGDNEERSVMSIPTDNHDPSDQQANAPHPPTNETTTSNAPEKDERVEALAAEGKGEDSKVPPSTGLDDDEDYDEEEEEMMGDDDDQDEDIMEDEDKPPLKLENETEPSKPKDKKVKKRSSSLDHTTEAVYVDHSNTIFNEISGRERSALQLYHEDTVGGPFPIKLQILLKVVEKLGKQHIIAWLPHGRSFIIHRPREFERDLMGQFFNNTKFSSFKRQLNLYDFKRVTHGANGGSYYHELFLRGKPLLATKMVRRKIKGNMRLSSASTRENGPEFYAMPFLGPASTSDYPQDDFNSFNMLSRAAHARDHHQQQHHTNPLYQQSSAMALHSMGRGDMNIMDDHRLSSSSMLSRLQQQHQGGLGGYQPPTMSTDPLLLNSATALGNVAGGGGGGGRGLLPPYADDATSMMLSSTGAGGMSDITRSRGSFDDPSSFLTRNPHNYHDPSLGSLQASSAFSQNHQHDSPSNLLQNSAAAFGSDSLGGPHSRHLQHSHQHLLANNSIASSLSQRHPSLQDAVLQDRLLLENQLLHNQLIQQMSGSERSAAASLLPNPHMNNLTRTNDRLNSTVGGQLPQSAFNSNISNMSRAAAYQGLAGEPVGGGVPGASSPLNHATAAAAARANMNNLNLRRDLSSSLVNEQEEAEAAAVRAAAMRGGYPTDNLGGRNNLNRGPH